MSMTRMQWPRVVMCVTFLLRFLEKIPNFPSHMTLSYQIFNLCFDSTHFRVAQVLRLISGI
jgi:hypothetical protein